MAVWRNNRVDICPTEQGNSNTASYVAFTKGGTLIFGDAAIYRASRIPDGIIFDKKRLIGRTFSDSTVVKDTALFPFGLVTDKDGKLVIKLEDKISNAHSKKTQFTLKEISGIVLRKRKLSRLI